MRGEGWSGWGGGGKHLGITFVYVLRCFLQQSKQKILSKKCYTDLYLQLEEDQTRPTTSLPFIVRMQLKIYFNLND